MARKTKRLFTIGYEQTPAKAVLDELEHAGVKLLVDVRAVAASRRPGFSRTSSRPGLDERGISYLHLRGLGTPKDGREAARSGKFDLLHKIYAAHLKTPQAQGRTRRAVGAGQEVRAGLHPLLRARSRALPPAMDRRDHRRPRRRQDRESGGEAGVIVIPVRAKREPNPFTDRGVWIGCAARILE